MNALAWLSIACPLLTIAAFICGALWGEAGRRLMWLEEFDPSEALANAWDEGAQKRAQYDPSCSVRDLNPYRQTDLEATP